MLLYHLSYIPVNSFLRLWTLYSAFLCHVFLLFSLCYIAGVTFLLVLPILTFKNLCPIYRTGVPLPSKCCILYIFSANISTEYFKQAAHSPFFSSKCRLFHNATFFGSCIIRILHMGCAKI